MESPRVLIAEDDPVLSEAIAATLGVGGFAPEVVSTRAKASARLQGGSYAVVVLDLDLGHPDDGAELLAQARSLSDPPQVFVVTGRWDEENDRRLIERGASAVLHKPFSPLKLLDLVHHKDSA